MSSRVSRWILNTPIEERLLRSVLDYLILLQLSQKPFHGYALINHFRKKWGLYFGPSTIYPILAMFETHGLAESAYEIKDKPRKMYKITQKGLTLLRKTEEKLQALSRHKDIAVLVDALEH